MAVWEQWTWADDDKRRRGNAHARLLLPDLMQLVNKVKKQRSLTTLLEARALLNSVEPGSSVVKDMDVLIKRMRNTG